MASGNSSIKRKSSSSHKKKSSEVKRKKRSRSSKRDKSKKIRRRDVPVSYSDDSRTEDSLSISSSDSEDGSKHRKGRSRTREDVKGGKKKVRRSSLSSEDRRDSPIRKKRKRNDGSKVRKKSLQKKPRNEGVRRDVSVDSPGSELWKKSSQKKLRNEGVRRDVSVDSTGSELRKKSRQKKPRNEGFRRDVSVDSIGSDSRSCLYGTGSSSEESEVERLRGRSKGREKSKRSSGKKSNGKDRYRYRSRSCSSCSGCSKQSHYHNDDRWMSEDHSRRLRSVLTVPNDNKEGEGRDRNKGENNAEIIQAYDDCPSCRSNDSYDGGRYKESLFQVKVEDVSEKKRQIQDKVGDASTSKIKTTQFEKSSRGDAGTQCGRTDSITDVRSTNTGIESEVSSGIGVSEVSDLESILRQKALENLRKFRWALKTNTAPGDQKGENNVGVKQSSTKKAESIQLEPHKGADGRVAGGDIVAPHMENVSTTIIEKKSVTKPPKHGQVPDGNCNRLESQDQHMKNVSTTIIGKKSVIKPPPKLGQVPDGNCNRLESRDKLCTANPQLGDEKFSPDRGVHQKKNIIFGAVSNSSHGTSKFRRESSGNHSTEKAPKSHDCPDGKFQDAKNILDKIVVEPPKAALGCSNPRDAEIKKVPGSAAPEVTSCPIPATGGHGSNEAGNAAKGGSEFEQKTMSVMRGGEMVQVSYKVYIPKKPPALSRRQLQR